MLNQILADMIATLGSRSAKAHASGAAAALAMLIGPGLEGFQAGFSPSVVEVGAMLGSALGAYLVGHVAAWLPANRAAPDHAAGGGDDA